MTMAKNSKYDVQVSHNHYGNDYNNFERYVSYYNQIRFISSKLGKKGKVLEIGVGSGFIKDQLSKDNNISYKSFDISKDLSPDFVGNIIDLSKVIGKEKFDVSVCFEVLEHIKFEDVAKALKEIKSVTNKSIVISIPQTRLYWSVAFKLPKRPIRKLMANLPFPLKHKFDGQHYWELGKKGYPRKSFRKLLNDLDLVYTEYTDPLNPYHRFFICDV